VELVQGWGVGPMTLPGSRPDPQAPGRDADDRAPLSGEPGALADDGYATALEPPIDMAALDPVAARAFVETLFAKHHGEIYAYLVRMVRDSELAADLAQDAFIRAYRALASLEDARKARAWLYQIANRVALDELRRRRIIRFVPWTGESHGSAPSAERLAMDLRLSGELERALARIPERQRAALLLAEVHDLTGLELAAALGTSHVAARALLTRGRESLRRALAEEQAASAARETELRMRSGDSRRGSR
jgi:RNA polymerase sigma-70 factor (ECF subfamily)